MKKLTAPLSITCSWQKPNPPKTVSIYNWSGKEASKILLINTFPSAAVRVVSVSVAIYSRRRREQI